MNARSVSGKRASSRPTLQQMVGLTGFRKEGFEFMIRHLRQRARPRIVETGCARADADFAGDGSSTVIFDAIAEEFDGSVFSVDINAAAVAAAQRQVGPRTTVHCEDSVSWLAGARRKVDLLYLDSFDFDAANPWPSMAHHMQELAAARHLLKPGTLVAVDDNIVTSLGLIGKGAVINQFFARIGVPLVFEGYHRIWRIPDTGSAAFR